MKRTVQTIMAAVAVVCLSAPVVSAQGTANQERSQANQRAEAGKLDQKTRGTNIRVSQLLGQNIQNSQGESVGEIKDLVLDASTGKIRYAAVTYGGFLGLGNKLFAVPIEAFKVQVDPDEVGDDDIDADDYVLVLNVTQQQLEGQAGFDEDNWPNMADRQWARELDKRYGVQRNPKAKKAATRANRNQ